MRLARAQRLTGRATELGRAEARSAVRGRGVPGGSHVRPTRTTETGPRDDRPHTGATSLQTCLVFSAPRPRPSKSPGIHRKNSGPPPSDPGVRASAGLGGGGGSLARTRLARRQANTRRIRDPGSVPRISCFRSFDRLGGVGETAGKCRRTGFHRSNVLHSPYVVDPRRVGIPLVPGFKTFDRPPRRSQPSAVVRGRRQRPQCVVGQRPDRAKGMIGRHALFRREVAEYVAPLRSAGSMVVRRDRSGDPASPSLQQPARWDGIFEVMHDPHFMACLRKSGPRPGSPDTLPSRRCLSVRWPRCSCLRSMVAPRASSPLR